MIIAGGGVSRRRGWDELLALAELLDAPVVMTRTGSGRRLGAPAGVFSRRCASCAGADAVLAVGRRGRLANPLGGGRCAADPDRRRRRPSSTGPSPPTSGSSRTEAGPGGAGRAVGKPTRSATRAARSSPGSSGADQYAQPAEPQATFGGAAQRMPDETIFVPREHPGRLLVLGGLPIEQPRTFIGSGYQGRSATASRRRSGRRSATRTGRSSRSTATAASCSTSRSSRRPSSTRSPSSRRVRRRRLRQRAPDPAAVVRRPDHRVVVEQPKLCRPRAHVRDAVSAGGRR